MWKLLSVLALTTILGGCQSAPTRNHNYAYDVNFGSVRTDNADGSFSLVHRARPYRTLAQAEADWREEAQLRCQDRKPVVSELSAKMTTGDKIHYIEDVGSGVNSACHVGGAIGCALAAAMSSVSTSSTRTEQFDYPLIEGTIRCE